ncbi:siderophore ABC transporter substrate-binding protein [Epibacterium sp. MM17-32]|uniref:siderophore ABC transporter substrate-binding protein n=1 Tax=Epibacterium sp. MM17-32 TaxID=2917734 RepID=UPI001EF56175|nr:siderophore ABC transporter substrate-binding protein [Epibacterium sp. MM17-32]MCG7628199.1 siderophore ABC transporter substrate-binding protein [Epibacterium sp. MM17-32]
MFRSLACGAALLLALPAFAADTVSIDTYRGTVEVPEAPEKIAVFDIAAVDTLSALGVDITGAPQNLYVDYLDSIAEKAEDLGTLFEPDIEAVHALQPDLIIVGGRSSDQVEPMSELAPAIDMTIWEDVVGQGLDRLEAYGRIFDLEDKAAELRAAFDTQLADTRAAVAGQGTALILLTNGPKISAYGKAGRFGWLHSTLDLPEAAAEISDSTHGESISFEFIQTVNPDWLIVIDRLAAIGQPGEDAKTTLDNTLVHETTAWKNDQVVYLNASDIYISGGGIQSMMRTLSDIEAGFSGN